MTVVLLVIVTMIPVQWRCTLFGHPEHQNPPLPEFHTVPSGTAQFPLGEKCLKRSHHNGNLCSLKLIKGFYPYYSVSVLLFMFYQRTKHRPRIQYCPIRSCKIPSRRKTSEFNTAGNVGHYAATTTETMLFEINKVLLSLLLYVCTPCHVLPADET